MSIRSGIRSGIRQPIRTGVAIAGGAFVPSQLAALLQWAKNLILPRTDWNTPLFQLNDSSPELNDIKLNNGVALNNSGTDNDRVNVSSIALSGQFVIRFIATINAVGDRYVMGNNEGLNYIILSGTFLWIRINNVQVAWNYTSTTGRKRVLITRRADNTLEAFFDGVSLGAGDVSTAGTFTCSVFGRRDASFKYTGILKDVLLLNTSYTAAQALEDHNNPQQVLSTGISRSNIVRHYKLNQGRYVSGSIVIDSGPNASHGSFVSDVGTNKSIGGISIGYQQCLSGFNTYGVSALSGTWTNSTTTMSGTSGAATTELIPLLSWVRFGNEIRQVTAVTDDNTFTIASAFTGTYSGASGQNLSEGDKTNFIIIDGEEYNSETDLIGREMYDYPYKAGVLNFIGLNANGTKQTGSINIGNAKALHLMIRVWDASVDQTILETGGGVVTLTSGAFVASEFDDIKVNMDVNVALDHQWMYVYISSTTDVNLSAFAVDETFDGEIFWLVDGNEEDVEAQENIWTYFLSVLNG